MMTEELYHHGIPGQKWGKRHGPPYPLERQKRYGGSEKNGPDVKPRKKVTMDEAKAHVKKAYADINAKNEVKKQERQAKAAEKAEARQAKAAEKRDKAVMSGKISPRDMTDEELTKVINRERLEKAYRDLIRDRQNYEEAVAAKALADKTSNKKVPTNPKKMTPEQLKEGVERKRLEESYLNYQGKKSDRQKMLEKTDVLKLVVDDNVKNVVAPLSSGIISEVLREKGINIMDKQTTLTGDKKYKRTYTAKDKDGTEYEEYDPSKDDLLLAIGRILNRVNPKPKK